MTVLTTAPTSGTGGRHASAHHGAYERDGRTACKCSPRRPRAGREATASLRPDEPAPCVLTRDRTSDLLRRWFLVIVIVTAYINSNRLKVI